MNKTEPFQFPEMVPTPSRFRNPIGKYRLHRTSDCIACGKCVEICPYGVHVEKRGRVLIARHDRCVGPECSEPCYEACPVQALTVRRNIDFDCLGDFRWTPDLLVSTWHMAELGRVPEKGLEYKTGASGGGFDKLRIKFKKPEEAPEPDNGEPDLGVTLNRRNDTAHRIRTQVPFYGGGMS